MPYSISVRQDDSRLRHVHNLALRTEIGEALRTRMGTQPVALPLFLHRLMTRLRDAPPVLET